MKPNRLVFAVSVLFTIVGCRGYKTQDASTVLAAQEPALTTMVNGNAAKQVYAALQAAGVPNSAQGVGGEVRASPDVRCSKGTSPAATASCQIAIADDLPIDLSGDQAKALLQALDAAGARYSDGLVGASLVWAKELECLRSVVPGFPTKCTMKVQGAATPPAPPPTVHTFDGVPAAKMFDILAFVGVPNSAPGVGAEAHEAQVTCESTGPTAIPPQYTCKYAYGSSPAILKEGNSSKRMYELLIDQQATTSTFRVEVKLLKCTRPIVPNAPTRCEMTVQ